MQLKQCKAWLVGAVCGPMHSKPSCLLRTRLVLDLSTAAIAAVENHLPSEAVDEPAVAVASQAHDPMSAFPYGHDGSQPQGVGDSCETPKRQTQRRVESMAVALEMQDKCRDAHPHSAGVRQVFCYVEFTPRRGARKVWLLSCTEK